MPAEDQSFVPSDNPIISSGQDGYQRNNLAIGFAQHIMKIDCSQGLVASILAPWGYGKTSFLNLVKAELAIQEITTIEFNPWAFSGSDQLVSMFFSELSAELKMSEKLKDVAERLENYGEVFVKLDWVPFAGPSLKRIGGLGKSLSKIIAARKRGTSSLRSEVSQKLQDLEKPIVVMLDDIDRLGSSEIRDIFKLIRLTANFPNVIYVLAFDRARVEKALSQDGIEGRAYLEKIVQYGFDLPNIPRAALDSFVFSELDILIGKSDIQFTFNEGIWVDIYFEIVQSLVRSPRDVKRFTMALSQTLPSLGASVELSDVVALEAVRVFLPDLFQKISEQAKVLTSPAMGYSAPSKTELDKGKAAIDQMKAAAGNHADIVDALLDRLFVYALRYTGGSNYGNDWEGEFLRNKRVASQRIFRFYLERALNPELKSYQQAEILFEALNDEEQLQAVIEGMDVSDLEDAVKELSSFKGQFVPSQAIPGIAALLNLLNTLPKKPKQSLFDFGSSIHITRVVLRILESLGTPEAVMEAVSEILPRVQSLSSKLELVELVGHREGVGQKLVTEGQAKILESEWLIAVEGASQDAFESDGNLIQVFYGLGRLESTIEPVFNTTNTIVENLLYSAYTESLTQTFGTRRVKREGRLDWDRLMKIFGSEEKLIRAIKDLAAERQVRLGAVYPTAVKYSHGWRPESFQ